MAEPRRAAPGLRAAWHLPGLLLGGALVATLAACAAPAAPPASAQVPADAFGPGGSPDLLAITLAERDFADASRTYGRPAEAARAAAAVEYLAGALSASPRWAEMDPQVRADMLDARAAVRAAIAASPGAASQLVVDDLLAAARALDQGDMPAARASLAGFAAAPDETLRLLGNLPYLRIANVATHEAAARALAPDREQCSMCD